MPRRITKAQRLHLDRLCMGSFNRLDGEKVADCLKTNKLLWDSLVFWRSGRYGVGELIELRDLPDGRINADELMIVTDKDRWPKLSELIDGWDSAEVGYNTGDDQTWGTPPYHNGTEVGDAMGCHPVPNTLVLVRVWWD